MMQTDSSDPLLPKKVDVPSLHEHGGSHLSKSDTCSTRVPSDTTTSISSASTRCPSGPEEGNAPQTQSSGPSELHSMSSIPETMMMPGWYGQFPPHPYGTMMMPPWHGDPWGSMMAAMQQCMQWNPSDAGDQRLKWEHLLKYSENVSNQCKEHLRKLDNDARPTTQTKNKVKPSLCRDSTNSSAASTEEQDKQEDISTYTTVMLKNIPPSYDIDKLLDLLNEQGFMAKYDFVYLPVDFKKKTKLGYAFVNLIDHACALEFKEKFNDFGEWGLLEGDHAKAETRWGQQHCKKRHIQRYRDSPLMHPSVPREYKPVVFDRNGQREDFPAPTKRLQPPRAVKASASSSKPS